MSGLSIVGSFAPSVVTVLDIPNHLLTQKILSYGTIIISRALIEKLSSNKGYARSVTMNEEKILGREVKFGKFNFVPGC